MAFKLKKPKNPITSWSLERVKEQVKKIADWTKAKAQYIKDEATKKKLVADARAGKSASIGSTTKRRKSPAKKAAKKTTKRKKK